MPESRRDVVLSATISSASSWRSILSVRQSFASSIAARSRLPRCSSSFASKREKSANASAEEPANPAMTSPPFRRRIFAAVCFITVVPSVTWPSDAIATRPLWRTQTTVVECQTGFFMERRIADRGFRPVSDQGDEDFFWRTARSARIAASTMASSSPGAAGGRSATSTSGGTPRPS